MRILALLPLLLAAAGPVRATASLAVSETQNPPTGVVAGAPVEYRIVVANLGPTVTELVVADTLPPFLIGVTAFGPSGLAGAVLTDAAPSGTLVCWTLGGLTMATGDAYTFTITGMVGPVCPPVTGTSTAYAWGTDGGAPDEQSAAASFQLALGINTALVQTPASPGPGTVVRYDLYVNNTGQVTLEDLVVLDTLAAAFTAAGPAATPPGFAVAVTPGPAGTLVFTWTGGGVSPGASLQFSVTGTFSAVCVPLTVSNTGWARARSSCSAAEQAPPDAGYSYDPGSISPPANPSTHRGDKWAVVCWESGNEGIEFVNRYHLWRSEDGGGSYTFAGTSYSDAAAPFTSTDTRMFLDVGLTNAQTYTYLVQGLSGCVTAFSAPVVATPTGYVGSVTAFGTVFADAGDGYVKLHWTSQPFPGETQVSIYRVFRAARPDGPWPATETFQVQNAGDYIDQPLTNLQPYYYLVVPCCPDRCPSYAWSTPYRPSHGQGEPGARTDASGPRAVRVFWDPAAPGDYPLLGYRVYRSDDGGASAHLVSGLIPVTQLTFVDVVPGYGKQYVYIIRPVDAAPGVAAGIDGIAYRSVLIFVAIPVNRLFLNHNQFHPARNEVLDIVFQITEAGRTRISIFTPTGERVRLLWDKAHTGSYSPDAPFNSRDQGIPPLVWDGTNERGELVGSGAYLVVLEVNKARDFRTVVVVR